MAKPIIAITGPARGAFGPRTCVAWIILWFGGRALQLKPGDEKHAPHYDAVVVTGGHDVEPVLYAAKPEVESNYDSDRDTFEMAIINNALEKNIPLLGICRGAQLLNVCCKGTLFQELRLQRENTSNKWTILPFKKLYTADKPDIQNGLIQTIIGKGRFRINSLHNQGIDQVGDHLVVTARDSDNIVQAIEAPSKAFMLGVQWHPEFLLYMRSQRALFRALVNRAKHNQNYPLTER